MENENTNPDIINEPESTQQAAVDNESTPTAVVPSVPKQINRNARIAFAGAMLAEVLFILSALVPYTASLILSGISAVIALTSLVWGFVALRSRPRNLAVGAIIFSGVLVIIYTIVALIFIMLPQLLNASTSN